MGKASFTPDRIKAVFFDVNETLIDPRNTLRQAFQLVWGDMSGRWETGVEKPDAGKVWDLYREEWKAPSRRTPSYRNESWTEAQKRNMDALAAALRSWELNLPEPMLRTFFQKVHEAQEKHPALYPGTAETLQALSKSYKLAIISNGFQDKQTRRLRSAGQLPPLREDRMVFSAAIGVRKPDPAIFRHALDRLGVKPDQAVMVGNSWTKDILGAVKVHMNAVWFHPVQKQKYFRRKVGSKRIHVVQSMEQLLSLFET